MAPTKFRPQSPGIDSANEVKRPPGVFYFEGAPINRQTIAQSQSAEYRKTLLCGYCGNQLRHRYKCHNCSKRAPRSQEEGTKDHHEILELWKDGDYVTNVMNENTRLKEPSKHGDIYSLEHPSMSAVSLNDFSISRSKSQIEDLQVKSPHRHSNRDKTKRYPEPLSSRYVSFGDTSYFEEQSLSTGRNTARTTVSASSNGTHSILSTTKLKHEHPPADEDNLAWTTAIMMGWRSHQKRLPEEMSYDFRRHLFVGNRTDDHFKMRRRTKKEFIAETACERLWLPHHKEYILSKKMLTGKFNVQDYHVLQDREKSGTVTGWKKPLVQESVSQEYGHLLYGPGVERDPKNKGFATISEKDAELLRTEKLKRCKVEALRKQLAADGYQAKPTPALVGIGMSSMTSSVSNFPKPVYSASQVSMGMGAGSRDILNERMKPKPEPIRHFRSTGGEDRPHYVERSRDLRRLKF
jgi:hypothetical protein